MINDDKVKSEIDNTIYVIRKIIFKDVKKRAVIITVTFIRRILEASNSFRYKRTEIKKCNKKIIIIAAIIIRR